MVIINLHRTQVPLADGQVGAFALHLTNLQVYIAWPG